MALLRQSGLAAASAILLTGSRFAFTAILARTLAVELFGQYSYAQWIVDIAFLICSLGATGAAGRYFAEYRAEPQRLVGFINEWKPWANILPAIAGAMAVVGARLSGYGLDLPTGLALGFWAASSGYMALYTAVLAGLQRFDLILITNVVLATVMLIGVSWMPSNGFNLTGLFILMAIANLLAAIPGWVVAAQVQRSGHVGSLIPADTKLVKKYAINMWMVALLWSLVWSRGELPYVKVVLGDSAVAGYVAALTIFGGAIQGVMLGVSAVAPQLTRLIGEGKKKEAVQLARKITEYQLIICGMAISLLALLAPEIMNIAFGERYKSYAYTLTVLSFGVISMAFSTQNHILQIVTNGRYSLLTTIAGLAFLGIFVLLLTDRFGVLGVAASRTVAISMMGLLSIIVMITREGNASVPILQTLVTAAFLLLIIFIGIVASDGRIGQFVRWSVAFTSTAIFIVILAKKINYRNIIHAEN